MGRDYRDWLNNLREPQWVIEMRDYYYKHGTYRAEDLRRVLGEPSRGVSTNPEEMRRLFLSRLPSIH
ncbi:MAG: hypothetical protein MUF61_02155 [archaeon]|jgi:hypothetical protein|nr:hypothetical protein [archaeon]